MHYLGLMTATGGNTIDNFGQSILNIVSWIQPISSYLLVIAVLIVAALLMVPGERSHHSAFKYLPRAVIGFAIFMGAINIAADIADRIVF